LSPRAVGSPGCPALRSSGAEARDRPPDPGTPPQPTGRQPRRARAGPSRRSHRCPGRGPSPSLLEPRASPAGTRPVVDARHQSAQRDDPRAGLVIEVHDRACSAYVAEHADSAAKADPITRPKLTRLTAVRLLVHLV